MQKISILGCGWLGHPLAKALGHSGYHVKGSTTSYNKLAILEGDGIQPYLISLSENGIQGNLSDFLSDSQILIIDIPPKLRAAVTESFVTKIQNLIPYIEQSGIPKVLFISSTSVYADDNTTVTEITAAIPDTESGRQLLQVEALLNNNTQFSCTIIRFAGLTGPDRHPIRFLAAKENIENPDAPVNLIHQQDCIAIILNVIEKESWNEIFNAAAPYHPDRKTYYTQKALATGLIPPLFNHDKKSVGKTILSDKLQQTLNYKFHITATI